MTDVSDLESRLRSLGTAAVDESVARQHLEAMAFIPTEAMAPLSSRRSRFVVMGALVAGSVVGGSTLAGAASGNLPDAAQDVAHTVLAKVGIDVPEGEAKSEVKASKEDGPGNVERFLGDADTPCTNPDGSAFVGNHGQYVKAHPDDPATADVNERETAAQSRCGKPIQAGTAGDDADADAGKPETAGTPEDKGKPADTGRPEDAGKPETAGTPEDTGKPADVGEPEAPGNSAEHKPAKP